VIDVARGWAHHQPLLQMVLHLKLKGQFNALCRRQPLPEQQLADHHHLVDIPKAPYRSNSYYTQIVIGVSEAVVVVVIEPTH
jgi:hypothetical protein